MNIKPVENYGAGLASMRPLARDAISAELAAMLASPDKLVELEISESLSGGLYTRTLFIPKGVRLIGKIHKKPCVNIVAKGDISIMTESGAARVQAGYSVTSPAGMQKVGYAHEDTIFINVFRTDETDITKVEADLICESFEALECVQEKLCLG